MSPQKHYSADYAAQQPLLSCDVSCHFHIVTTAETSRTSSSEFQDSLDMFQRWECKNENILYIVLIEADLTKMVFLVPLLQLFKMVQPAVGTLW